MSEYIPLEVQAEILKRLPLKPLVQFRSVSKTWKRLIDSPNFIASYGVRHPHPDRFILRYLIPPTDAKNPTFVDKYLSFVDNDDHSFVLEDFIPTIPDLIKTLDPRSDVVGSSHGLVCVNGYIEEEYSDGDDFSYKVTEMVILWNPSICKSVGIEVPYIYNFPKDYLSNFRVDNVIGFGVCPVTFDPTILKIQYIDYKRKMKDMPSVSIPWKVRLFTLSTGTWSNLSTNLPRESIRLSGSQAVIDRFIYWVAYDMREAEDQFQSRDLIMSFDLTAKVFKEINLTGSLTNQQCSIQTMSKLRESLVLLEYHTEFEEDTSVCCCCLWMMKKEGDSRLFTKLYAINLRDAIIHQILGFRKSGELIMETREDYDHYAEVQIYKQNNGHTDNLGIFGEPYFSLCVPIWKHCFCLTSLMVIYIRIVCK